MEKEDKISHQVKIKIYGKVHGVGFRYGIKDLADRHHITGECHNSSDGSVSCTAQGHKTDLEALVEWCHHGPSHAKVEKVDWHWQDVEDEHYHFTIK